MSAPICPTCNGCNVSQSNDIAYCRHCDKWFDALPDNVPAKASTETCPMCNTPGSVNLGDFCHCDACNHIWYVKSEDIDVTEAEPE